MALLIAALVRTEPAQFTIFTKSIVVTSELTTTAGARRIDRENRRIISFFDLVGDLPSFISAGVFDLLTLRVKNFSAVFSCLFIATHRSLWEESSSDVDSGARSDGQQVATLDSGSVQNEIAAALYPMEANPLMRGEVDAGSTIMQLFLRTHRWPMRKQLTWER